MRGANSVALLQLCDAVPIIQLLGLILASAHIEAIPSYGGQKVRANTAAGTLSTHPARLLLQLFPSHLPEGLQAGYTSSALYSWCTANHLSHGGALSGEIRRAYDQRMQHLIHLPRLGAPHQERLRVTN